MSSHGGVAPTALSPVPPRVPSGLGHCPPSNLTEGTALSVTLLALRPQTGCF